MTCIHHWRIAPPEGPTSEGVCKLCGATYTFRNSVDEYGPERRVAAHTQYCSSESTLAEAYKE